MMTSMELEPWIVLVGSESEAQPALWKVSGQANPAIAFFSSEAAASSYAMEAFDGAQVTSLKHCDRTGMLRLLIECHKQNIELVALDPRQGETKKVFQIAEVLKAAREQLG
ncbi:MAG: hypothetical protein AAGG44_03315 [Planctomycetota bacterium]